MPPRQNGSRSGAFGFANPLALIVGGVASLLAGMLGTAHPSPALQYPAAQPAAVALPVASPITPPATASAANATPAPTTDTLTVINDYFAASIKLVSGTRFEDAAGEIFRSTQAVTVPGKRGTTNGTAAMSVVPDQPGAAPAGRLTLPGLAGSPAYFAHVYAIAATSTETSGVAAQAQPPHFSDLSSQPTATTGSAADPPHYATRADLSNLAAALAAAIAATNQGQGSANFVTTPEYESLEKAVSDASRISTLNNVTVDGVSGLTSSDIPDLSGSYLSLSGGNLTGSLGIGTTSPISQLDVEGWTATKGDCSNADCSTGNPQINVSGTLDTSITSPGHVTGFQGIWQTVGANTGTSNINGMRLQLDAGYTGGGTVRVADFQDYVAGSAHLNSGNVGGTLGASIESQGTSTGDNAGVYAIANGATGYNVALLGRSYDQSSAGTDGIDIGVMGYAGHYHGSNASIGGWFAAGAPTGMFWSGSTAINASTSAVIMADSETSGVPLFYGRAVGSVPAFTITGAGGIISTSTANATNFWQVLNSSGSPLLDLDTTDMNVGIGTTSPTDNFVVSNRSSTATFGLVSAGNSVGSGNVRFDLQNGDANKYSFQLSGNGNTLLRFQYDGATVDMHNSDGSLALGYNAAAAAALPGSMLYVNGVELIASSTNPNSQNLLALSGGNIGSSDLGFISNPSNNVWSLGYGAPQNASTLATSALTWNAAGNVGIGTTTPWASLSVSAPNNSSVPELVVGSSTATSLFVSNSGSVAIGTTTTTHTDQALGGLLIVGDMVTDRTLEIHNNSAEAIDAYTHSDTSWRAPVINLYKSGGTQNAPTAVLNGDQLGLYQFGGYDGTAYETSAIIQASVDANWTASSWPTSLDFQVTPLNSTSLVDAMHISNSGNVGIGTTSPATTLSVAGNGYLTGGLGVGVLNTTAGTLNVSNNFLVNASGNTTINTNLTLGKIGSGNAITSNQPSLVVQQRMNNAAVNFDLFTLNLEDQSSNTYSTLLKWENSAASEGCILRSGVLWVGTCPTSDPVGDDPTIESLRGIGNTYPGGYTASGDAHGFVDRNTINRSNGGPIGYNSYDARVNFNDNIGSTNYSHYAAFQSRPTYQMTGTITNHYGLYDGPTVASGATLTNRNGAYIAEANNSGTISNEFGVYVEGLTAGSNSNYAIYTAGATKSYFGGNVGIGTTTSFGKFAISLNNGDTNTNAFVIASSTANAATTLFTVLNTGNATLAGTLTQNSDARLKTDIQTLDASSSLDEIEALNPVSYQWQSNIFGAGQQLGFIAQQVQQQFPQLVATTAPTALTPGGTLGLNYTGLIAPIVGAIKALAGELSSLETTVAGFAESFTSKSITTGKLCATKSDGTQVCLAGDQLAAFLAADGGSISAAPAQSGPGSAPTDIASTTTTDATSTPAGTADQGAATTTPATSPPDTAATSTTPTADPGTQAPDQQTTTPATPATSTTTPAS